MYILCACRAPDAPLAHRGDRERPRRAPAARLVPSAASGAILVTLEHAARALSHHLAPTGGGGGGGAGGGGGGVGEAHVTRAHAGEAHVIPQSLLSLQVMRFNVMQYNAMQCDVAISKSPLSL